MILYETKEQALTIEELDGNFKELESRINSGLTPENVNMLTQGDIDGFRESIRAEFDAIKNDINIRLQILNTLKDNGGEVSVTEYDDTNIQSRITELETKASTEFVLQDFSIVFNTPIEVPSVTTNVENTAIQGIDVKISDEVGVEYAIVGVMKYEVKNDAGKRLNCFPVCSFSMDGQKTLRMRMMCAGDSSVFANSINGAILLKRRQAGA